MEGGDGEWDTHIRTSSCPWACSFKARQPPLENREELSSRGIRTTDLGSRQRSQTPVLLLSGFQFPLL